MIGDVVTGTIVPAPYAGTDTFRVEVRCNGIATSGHLVRKADVRAFLTDRAITMIQVDGLALDLSDHRLDIPLYFDGDRAALVVWLQDAVKFHQRIVLEYQCGKRGKNLDAAGRAEMLAEAKGILAAVERQLQVQQAALAVGL